MTHSPFTQQILKEFDEKIGSDEHLGYPFRESGLYKRIVSIIINLELEQRIREDERKKAVWSFATFIALKGIESAKMLDLYEEYIQTLTSQPIENECPVCNGEGTYRQFVDGEMEVDECSRCKGSGKFTQPIEKEGK